MSVSLKQVSDAGVVVENARNELQQFPKAALDKPEFGKRKRIYTSTVQQLEDIFFQSNASLSDTQAALWRTALDGLSLTLSTISRNESPEDSLERSFENCFSVAESIAGNVTLQSSKKVELDREIFRRGTITDHPGGATLSGNGQYIASAESDDNDHTVSLWFRNIHNGDEITFIPSTDKKKRIVWRAIGFSMNGNVLSGFASLDEPRRLRSATGKIEVWDCSTLKPLFEKRDETLESMSLSADGEWIAAVVGFKFQSKVFVWNLRTQALLFEQSPTKKACSIKSVRLSTDGKLVAAIEEDFLDRDRPTNKIVVWDRDTRKILSEYKLDHQARSLLFSGSGDIAGAVSWQKATIWNRMTNGVQSLTSSGEIYCSDLSLDGSRLVLAISDPGLEKTLWNAGSFRVEVFDLATQEISFRQPAGLIEGVSLSGAGTEIALAGYQLGGNTIFQGAGSAVRVWQ